MPRLTTSIAWPDPSYADPHTSQQYSAVAEALTNVAKHSGAASCCWVTVANGPDRLGVEIVDDGDGGAHVAKGHGFSGLADPGVGHRRHADRQESPGGPTTIAVVLLC